MWKNMLERDLGRNGILLSIYTINKKLGKFMTVLPFHYQTLDE